MDIPDGGKGLTIGTKKITLRNQKQMVDTSDHIYMTRKKRLARIYSFPSKLTCL
jgi:hypothetical protein